MNKQKEDKRREADNKLVVSGGEGAGGMVVKTRDLVLSMMQHVQRLIFIVSHT